MRVELRMELPLRQGDASHNFGAFGVKFGAVSSTMTVQNHETAIATPSGITRTGTGGTAPTLAIIANNSGHATHAKEGRSRRPKLAKRSLRLVGGAS